jgi:hypothetical protein
MTKTAGNISIPSCDSHQTGQQPRKLKRWQDSLFHIPSALLDISSSMNLTKFVNKNSTHCPTRPSHCAGPLSPTQYRLS